MKSDAVVMLWILLIKVIVVVGSRIHASIVAAAALQWVPILPQTNVPDYDNLLHS